jgi:hypothetical protein
MLNIKALEGRKDLLWILRTTFTVKKTIEVTKRKENKTSNNLPKIYTNRLAFTSVLNRNTQFIVGYRNKNNQPDILKKLRMK